MNVCHFIGRLTRDVELRYTPNTNDPVANFGLALNRRYKTAKGEVKEETTFVELEAWGKTAEFAAAHFTKGSLMQVTAMVKQHSWEDKNSGEKRTQLRFKVNEISFVPGSSAKKQEEVAEGVGAGSDVPF